MTNEDLQQIQSLVNGAHRVLILTHKDPSIDTMASALALYLALSKMGKDATVAMESQPLVEVGSLVGVDTVKTSLTGKNLLLTYKPYRLGDFEKVSYLEDPGSASATDDSFKLTITPKEGYLPDPKNFSFSSTGSSADLIFTIEVLQPQDLGNLYDPQLFGTTPIINIDNHDPNKDYGRFNLVEPDAASISEIVTFFLRAINTQLDADIAGNLYQGISTASRNFQSPKVAAATFEAAAICLRSGAKPKTAPVPREPQPRPFPPQVARGATFAQPQPRNFSQPASVAPTPTTPSQNIPTTPVQAPSNQPAPSVDNGQPSTGNQNVPPDWTQPKAYRGTSVV